MFFCITSRTTMESWLELLVTKVNGGKPLSSVTACSVQDFVVILDMPLTRNFDILIHLGDCGFCRDFVVVSTKQWFSIGAGKHIGWISLTNDPKVPLILKFWFNSFNICLSKSIETYFVRYQNC